MKKILYNILIVAVMSLSFASCDKFLTHLPYDSIGTGSELSATDAMGLVTSAYQPLQWPKFYNMRIWSTDVVAGESQVGAGGGSDGVETQQLADFTAPTDNAAAKDLWRGTPGILRANLALEELDKQEKLDPALKTRLKGECYFLRAHYYFILVRFFGDVPLRTKPLYAGDDLLIARTPKEEVYRQIIADTKNAIAMLPYKAEYDSKNLGRACKEAAYMQLMKVYLTIADVSKYGEIITMCEDIEAQGYDLSKMPYADNWYNEETGKLNENGPESIFEIQYTGDPAAAEHWQSDSNNQSQWLAAFMAPRGSGMCGSNYGWHWVEQHFIDAYEPGDLRKDKTVFYEGCPPFDGIAYNPTWSETGYNVRKWCVPKSISNHVSNNPANTVVYRFADALLMKAEALNELGRTKDAQAPLNIVRARAGLDPVTTEDYEEMKAKIIHERRMELAFEGHRWFDMIRIDGGQYAVDFLHSIGRTRATVGRLLYPIPQSEIDANKEITQNEAYL